MSEPTAPTRPFYVTGGTLKPGEPSYVERSADTELYESLLAGEFCYVLTARQMGKSSLMARTAKRLEEAGVCSAIVDLTQIGSERGDQAAAQWYFGIANKIHQQLKITAPLRPWWQERTDLPAVQRLTDFFRELVLTHCPGRVVIFVDEIDSTIGLPFADDFFSALRACFNARATDDAFERLTFVLLGVASPDQLIRDPARTPFNIGKRIDLTDFTPAEARTLAPELHADPGEADRRLERILHWTGGHPYLSQALCRAVRERGAENGSAEESVDPWVEELFLTSRAQREETNLKHARARLEKRGPEGRRLLQLYRSVREGKPVPDQPTSPLFAQLKLAGVVKVTDEGRLAVRNRIYESVFTPEWAKSAMPADRGRQLAAATMAASLAGVLVWYAAFQPRPYEEAFRGAIQADAYNVALDAYTNLRANPFSRSRATDLMQQFWEQRALLYAQAGKRDESLLSYLKGLRLKDSERLRRRARNLVGTDYERLRLTLRHSSEVTAVAFSPDGGTVATGSGSFFLGSDKGVAQFWDAVNGKPLAPPLRYEGAFKDGAFSPDGRTFATVSSDDTVRLWDARSGKPLALPLQHKGFVYTVAFGPDGQTLATGSARSANTTVGAAWLWSIRSGTLLAPPLQHQERVFAVAFSPDGRTLATAADDSARLWDTRSGTELSPPLQHPRTVFAVAFSPDGRTLATGSSNAAWLWDTRSRKPLVPLLRHQGSVNDVAFSPGSRILATGSGNPFFGGGAAWLWDARSGELLAPPLQHQESVNSVAISPDGQTLATGSGNLTGGGTVRLWSAHTGKPTLPVQHQISFDIMAFSPMTFSPDGRTLAVVSEDGTVCLRDARTGKSLIVLLQHRNSALGVAFSPDGRTVLTSSDDNAVRLWDARTGKLLIPPLQHRKSIFGVAFSPDGSTIVTGSRDNTARLWDARTGKPLIPPLQHQSSVVGVAFSPDGRAVLTGSVDNTARLWDARTGKPLIPPLRHQSSVLAVAFSPDSGVVLTGCGDFSVSSTVQLWDARNGKPLTKSLSIQGLPETLAFNPNGKAFFVATGQWLNTYSWDGKKATPQSSQLLHGFWEKGFRFPSDCENCLQVVLGDTGNSFHLETLHLDGPIDSPIEGDPKELLEKWKSRSGLKFDDQMRPVPAVDLSGEAAGALGDGRRPPRAGRGQRAPE